MTTIDQVLRQAGDLLYTKRRYETDLNDVRKQLKSPRLEHLSSARLSDYEYRNLVSERERLEQAETQAWDRLRSVESELDKMARFLREQITASPQQAAEIAGVLNRHDKSGDKYLARVREQAVQTSIANARAEWNRTRSPAARQRLIDVLTQHGQWNDLLPLALEDVRNAPNDRRARQQLASVYEHLGKRDDLLALLKQDLASAPGDAALRRRIAELLVQMGRYDEAIDHLQRDIAAPKPEPWAADLMLQALERAKKTDALILFLRDQVKSDPRNAQWRQKLGAVLEQERRWDEYIAFLRDQVRFYPAEIQWRRKLDSVLEQNQRWNDLISLYEQDISRNAGDPKLRERVAVFYRKSGRLTEYVDRHLIPAAKRAPNDFAPKQAVVETLLEAHRDSDALLYIQEELATNRSGSSLLAQFTVLLVKQRRPDLVETLACHYLPQGKSQTNAYKEVARGYFQSSDLEKALAFLDRMVQRFPDNLDISDSPVTFLVETLDSPSSTTRATALKQLYGRHDRVRAVEPLKDLLETTRDLNIMGEIPTALVIIQQAEALPVLETALNSNFIALRGETAKALGELGDKRGIQLLRQRLKVEQDASVVAAIKDALQRIDPNAQPPLSAASVVLMVIIGGALGSVLAWLHATLLGGSWPSLPEPDVVVKALSTSVALGAVVIGLPLGAWRARSGSSKGKMHRFLIGILIGSAAGAVFHIGMVAVVMSSVSLRGAITLPSLMLVGAGVMTVFSALVVVAFQLDKLWILIAAVAAFAVIVGLLPLRWSSQLIGGVAHSREESTLLAAKPPFDAATDVAKSSTGTTVLPLDTDDIASPTPWPPSTPAAGIPPGVRSAIVVGVSDDHSLDVQLADNTASIRYAGLIMPTNDMPGAEAALQASREILLDQRVWFAPTSPLLEDAEAFAYVWLTEGTFANQRLVAMGYALPDFALPDDAIASQIKQAARTAWQRKAGFWAGGADVAPWAAVIVDVANIRQGPGTDRAVVAQAVRGDIFVINGRNANGDWLQIQAGDAVAA